jgi:hypothetical protein
MAHEEEGLLLADGLDAAFVGIVERFGQPPIACYDYDLVIQIFTEEGMTEEDALEHFQYNVIGGWVGDLTPCFLRRMTLQDAIAEASESRA